MAESKLINAKEKPDEAYEELRKHLIKAREKKSLILRTDDYIYVLYPTDDTFEKRVEVSYIFMDKLVEIKEMDAKEAILSLIEEVGTALPGYFNVPVINEYDKFYALLQELEKEIKS